MGFIDCGDPGDTLHEPCAACSPRYPERMRPQPLLRDVAYENEGALPAVTITEDVARRLVDRLLRARDEWELAEQRPRPVVHVLPAPRYIAPPTTGAPKVLEGHSR